MQTVPELFEAAQRFERAGRLAEAAGCYQRVTFADPAHAPAWHGLGCTALALGQAELAAAALERAAQLDPGQADYQHNLAGSHRVLGRMIEARAAYQRALALDPNSMSTRAHLALTLYALGERGAAEQEAQRALSLPRGAPEEHLIAAVILLMQGDLEQGWREHQWRLDMPPQWRRGPRRSEWDGAPLEGRTILLYAEQGFGDTLQCIRYVPVVRRRGGRPIVAVQPALVPLLDQAGLGPLVPLDEPWPPHNVHAAMFSLPWACGTRLDSVPAEVPYLQAAPALVERWQRELAAVPGLRVGIHWQGNPTFRFDRQRSLPLTAFRPLAEVPGVSLVSLQKNAGSEQLPEFAASYRVVDFGDRLDTETGAFMDTAAIMTQLDLVVTCDTAVAHLAGALGVRVWVPLSTLPDARWMLDRQDSPWYPTMRLFRQRRFGDWDEVCSRMAGELAVLAADTGRQAGDGR